MRTLDNRLVFSATDLSNHLACAHLTSLKRAVALGEAMLPRTYDDPGADALKRRGLEHEARVLGRFRELGLTVEHVPGFDPGEDYEAGWTDGAAKTLEAMRRGVDVIYQGRLYDGRWGGYPDFLKRVNAPSALGDWSYEVVDAKLAREAKGGAVLQIALYSDLLSDLQGLVPDEMHLALGRSEGALETFRFDEYSAYYRSVRTRFEAHVGGDGLPETYPEPVEHCHICDWRNECEARRRDDDHLSLVAGITRNQRARLADRGVETLARLGALELPMRPSLDGVGAATLARVREQARIQVEGRDAGKPRYELLSPVTDGQGLASLPEPSPGDLFFDIEGAQWALEDGLEYLFGFVDVDSTYTALWGLDRAGEKVLFERFIDLVFERLERHSDLHVYHYASYEKTAIKKLAGRHATREDDVDRLLKGGVFVDLYRAVRQGLRASVESYSIKKMEPFYGFDRDVDLPEATGALAAFEAWLELGAGEDAARGDGAAHLRDTVRRYNEDDCVSTLHLRDWLEALRSELAVQTGTAPPRPQPPDGTPSDTVTEISERVSDVYARLLRDVPDLEEDRSPEQQARWTLAHLLEFHRREDKSMWWEYFSRCDLSEEELVENRSTLGQLRYVGNMGKVRRSYLHRYQFPDQEHGLKKRDVPHDPATRDQAGTVHAIDEQANTIDLTRGINSEVPHPEALVPVDNIGDAELRESLLRLGVALAVTGLEGAGNRRAAADLLLRAHPRVGQVTGDSLRAADEDPLAAARRLALSLDRSTLPIQGPPGSGKTYTGARMITALLAAGKRVGITSTSHKVISKLLEEVCEAANEEGIDLRGIQKASENAWCGDPRIVRANGNPEVVEALSSGEATLAAGTAWLWSREEMAGSVDVLFVDEAGQVSLANVLAVSQAAASLVLLGDPQQLDQPMQGVHPPGIGVSALGHVLGRRSVMAFDRGLFLPDTWRMHRDICAFTSEQFYQKRLGSRDDLDRQRVNGPGPLGGTGLRFIPVEHNGNINTSPEETAFIAELVTDFLVARPTWIDRHGAGHPVRSEDVLVVAPYNAHVSALTAALPEGVPVGTVDKFQGQEAPVVIYAMASSTPEDAPRGMDFLYSLSRLNVATSRARCVAAIVGSPKLLVPACRSPRQMRLANGLCRFLEMAALIRTEPR